jgi:hypothetical protein
LLSEVQHSTAAGAQQGKRTARRMREIGAPGVTRTPGTQFRKLLSVVEGLDISIAPSGLAGPRRAWTAAAESETRERSAVCEGLEGLQGISCASCLRGPATTEIDSPHLRGGRRLIPVPAASDLAGLPQTGCIVHASPHEGPALLLRAAGARNIPVSRAGAGGSPVTSRISCSLRVSRDSKASASASSSLRWALRRRWASSWLSPMVFLGIHPRLMQAPPSGPVSTSATRAPSFTPCLSALMPAAPPPMTRRS